MTLPFIKMHGAGNDFVIFDARKKPLKLSRAQIVALADRHKGVGCDQVIVLEGKANMRIYNADGSESASCGNATRCVAWLLHAETGAKQVSITTKAGTLECEIVGERRVRVDMGVPRFGWRDIPLAKEVDAKALSIAGMQGVALSMGNPHAVFSVPDVAAANVAQLGTVIENDPLFPERVNVSFAQVVDKNHVKLRVWERGAGETLACGTAACATLVALCKQDLVARRADIELPGGVLSIEWDEKAGGVHMTGEVAKVFEGSWNV